MKTIIYAILFLLVFSSCDYDNYDPPKSQLTGRLVFEDESVGVRQGLNVLQLKELGWDNIEPIVLNLKQDGTFSSDLLDANYQLVYINRNGPWVNQPDTIAIQVIGLPKLDVMVKPFFMV